MAPASGRRETSGRLGVLRGRQPDIQRDLRDRHLRIVEILDARDGFAAVQPVEIGGEQIAAPAVELHTVTVQKLLLLIGDALGDAL